MGFFDKFKAGAEQALKKGGEFAESAVKKGSEIADKAVKKGGEVAELAKLNIDLKTTGVNLEKLFNKLGHLVYDKADEAEIAAVIVEIDDTKAAIEALKLEILAKSGKVICPGCGKELEDEAQFCKYCGAKLEKPEPEVTAEPETSAQASKAEAPAAKPLTADEFVSTFGDVMKKYDL